MPTKKAEQEAKKRYAEAITNHKQSKIDTYIMYCKSGETCLIEEPNPVLGAELFPILQGMGLDDKGEPNTPDLLKAGKIIISKCWIAGDEKIKKDQKLLAEAAVGAAMIIDLRIAEAKKN